MENNQELTVKSIAELINNKELWSTESPTAKYKGLGRLLSDINWSDVAPETIITRRGLRAFAMSIEEEEVRLDVLNFLLKFARDFFLDSAFNLSSWSPYAFNDYNAEEKAKKDAVEYIETFKEELNFQIDLINYSNQFSGEKFTNLQKKNQAMQEQIQLLKKANADLKEKLDKYEHPLSYGYYIPEGLKSHSEFYFIMEYLEKKELVKARCEESNGIYGFSIVCYQWLGEKALFGYYIERMNKELDLQEARMPLNWQIFKTAIFNYKDLIDEARKAVSNYNKGKTLKPAKADIIEDAINYANNKISALNKR